MVLVNARTETKISPNFLYANMKILRKEINFCKIANFVKLPVIFAPVLHIFSGKLLRRQNFSINFSKNNYFPENLQNIYFAKICQNYIKSSKYFLKNGSFVLHVADKFLPFVTDFSGKVSFF
jgi:hypothetical protein